MKIDSHSPSLFPLDNTKQKKLTWLSHTAIEMINSCPKCFWLKYNKKIYQPQGIVSRLSNRYDIVIKKYFNTYRDKDYLPPMIQGKIKGRLQNPFQERYYHKIDERYGFYGKLDECIVENDVYVPVDFKTTSSDPKEKEIMDAYRHQIDEYVFLLDANHKKTTRYGYLIFFYPEFKDSSDNGFPMNITVVKVEARPENVLLRIQKAIDILRDKMPESAAECPYCKWYADVKEYYE